MWIHASTPRRSTSGKSSACTSTPRRGAAVSGAGWWTRSSRRHAAPAIASSGSTRWRRWAKRALSTRRSDSANANAIATTPCRAPRGWHSRSREQGRRSVSSSGLLPGQPFLAPATDRPAVVTFVQRTLEAVDDVVNLGESGLLEFLARGGRALPAAADQHDRTVHARHFLHLPDEMRVHLPVGRLVPRHVVGPRRVADEQVFHFAAAIDHHCLRALVQEVEGFAGFQVLHRRMLE